MQFVKSFILNHASETRKYLSNIENDEQSEIISMRYRHNTACYIMRITHVNDNVLLSIRV